MEKKICTKCKDEKFLEEFNKNKTRKDGYNNVCRICSNNNSKQYYNENKEKHKKNIAKRNKKVILENRKKMYEFYKTHACVDCAETNPIVLECDHKKEYKKLNNLSTMVNNGTSWETIEAEIKKCDVRCANCHRIKTAKDQGWYNFN